MKYKKESGYRKAFAEYQGKQYLPGYYLGGKIHPALKAKTKAGGYLMILGGIFLFCFYLIQLVGNISAENIGWIFPIGFSVLLISVGFRFLKINRHS